MTWCKRVFIATVFSVLSVAAPFTQAASAQQSITVFAAASLKNALDAVGKAWAAETGNRAVISYAGSSALAKQIEQGAPADIFISADLAWMKYLSDKGLVMEGSEVALLGNRLVLVAPADSDVMISIAPGFELAATLGSERLAIANVDAVPAGRYGKQALESLGVWAAVKDNVAQAENVRAALALVALGEAPLGIVYETDAAAEPDVRVVGAFPDGSHEPIVYPAAALAEAKATEAFLNYLQTSRARSLFEEQGFRVLVRPASN